MQYTISHNGVKCALPTFTRSIKKKIDEVNEKISDINIALDSRIETIHDFLSEIVGVENLSKAVGSADLETLDLNELNILYLKLTREYDRPVIEFERPEMDANTKRLLQEINSVAKSVDSIQRAANK